MSRVLAGTSGYSFKEWKGVFYPAKLPERQFLPYYSERLPTVELNNTFYRTPTTEAVAAWCDAVPDTFCFSVKAPQRITHLSRLKNVEEHLRHFADVVRGFGSRLGVVLFQFPPQFPSNFERLQVFRDVWPVEIPTALEFRHASWNVAPIRDWMREQRLAWVHCDSETDSEPDSKTDSKPDSKPDSKTGSDPKPAPEPNTGSKSNPAAAAQKGRKKGSKTESAAVAETRSTPAPQRRAPDLAELSQAVGGDVLYVRLRRETYTDSELRQWAQALGAVEARRVFVFFKHEVSGPGYASTVNEHVFGAGEGKPA